jgi:hypothetical protein
MYQLVARRAWRRWKLSKRRAILAVDEVTRIRSVLTDRTWKVTGITSTNSIVNTITRAEVTEFRRDVEGLCSGINTGQVRSRKRSLLHLVLEVRT